VTYGLTARMRDIQKVLNELNRMSVKWKHGDSLGSRAAATKNGRRGAMRAA
jgi:hypothetical protein